MNERENLKNMLEKVIHDTENNKIKTTEEVIQTLIDELTSAKSKMVSDPGLTMMNQFYH
ncbi:hypothetical protein P5G51_006395 [Virgibacillus sp. 179-BFC.A HS]|uniref:Uncharacterized protein n=1 Tax=Tigheibacillus jepli TaxID=3035914 RepID=A0ABU5CFH5_9BACI|nr:hypothetical protein [Virgibacillus sp. 179-BFC.A HS]MDY0405075.1 hypothetical protein [Virgibacillus sp. 179-BFC.A HS]